uniref:DED domain-containing protein n=2 Tax=Branchiostoma floridae TaxID=7739 RepID=C3ZU53_BRAFL|eukprot:XP_002587928.1 hypothetical protein BRAFLDRAFT_87316 [Branchiostoma floridae]
MAGPVKERVTAADRRHFDFMETLLRISDELTEEETANLKVFCLHLIPKGHLEQLRRGMDVFVKLMELDKIDQENLDFIKEILERIGRQDLIRDVLRRFQQPDREIPENPELQPPGREIPEDSELQPETPELQPETSELQPETPELQPETSELQPETSELLPETPVLPPENPEPQPENPELQPGESNSEQANEGTTTSNIYVVVHGTVRMIQETLDHLRNRLATLCGTRRSQVKFRGYKKHKSILVHFSMPRENTAVLRHMADHSDPRLVYMGVKSLQIDAEVPIKVQQEEPLYDVRRQLPVDDIEVGCSTRTRHQRAPQSWTRLSALNLFSDALPLHLQAAASLEYQGFSYSLVRALVQKDRLREHQMSQAIQNLRNAEVDSNTLRQKAEVDSNTIRQKAEVDSNTLGQKAEVDSNTLRQKAEMDSNTLRQKAEVDSNTLRQKAKVDSNTIMTLRSKLDITENRLKEALETISVLEEKLQQAQEYAEKAAKQVTSHVTEYRGEKPPGDWPQEYRGEKPPGGWPVQMLGGKLSATGVYRGGRCIFTPSGYCRMAGPVRKRVDTADRRHFDFVQTLLRISDELTEEETANVKLLCLHLIPEGQSEQLKRAVDVFQKLIKMDKIDKENLDFLEEILERINRLDLIRDVLRRFQPPDRDIPENPELQPRSNDVGASKREAPKEERHTAEAAGAASGFTWDRKQDVITFGGKGSEPGKFYYPRGVVVSPSNEIFVADIFNKRVQVHSTEGVYLRHFPTVVPGTGGKVMEPYDVCMDGNGTLWVVGLGVTADLVVQYSTDGTAMAGFDLKNSSYYRGIAVDMRTNHILLTDADQSAVQVFRPDGSLVRTVQHPLGGMVRPMCVTVDGEGNILVSAWGTHSVYVYDESGKFLFQFGGHGSGEGQLKYPRGICTDSLGYIIVADYGNERVQIFTRHGEFVRAVRTGFEPECLAVGPEGQLVVSDWNNHTVTVFPNY